MRGLPPAACWRGPVQGAWVLLMLAIPLAACMTGRTTAEVAVAPDPVTYPPPAEAARYRPWLSWGL